MIVQSPSPRSVAILAGLALCAGRVAAAYEVLTHRLLATRAQLISTSLGEVNSVLNDLDWPISARYPDAAGMLRSVEGLLGVGAQKEDELPRPGFHFLDPQHGDRGLTLGTRAFSSSRDWALFGIGTPLPDWIVKQQFSYADARNHLWLALTSGTQEARDRNVGLMFQSLGHLAHHLQDMAQPDHVRNDQHLVPFDTSLHHTWTEGEGEWVPSFGYPKLTADQFNVVADLWTSAGRGIAEFTSYNFVSDDTNYRGQPPLLRPDPEFASPVPDNARIERVALEELLVDRPDLPAKAEIWFIGNHVHDRLNPQRSGFNPRGSAFSIFNADLGGYQLPGQTTINRFNAAAINQWLLPRAVAYSAALYDYFFRGRIQIESSVVEGNTIRLTVRNASASPYAFRAQQPGQGDGAEWSLHYDTVDGARSRLPLTGDDIGAATIASGSSYELSFPMPLNVDVSKDKPFMLVYNGVIGQEAGIAGKAFHPAASRGFMVRPGFATAGGPGSKQQLARMAGAWFSKPTQASAGNVDWKGHLPGDTLTWDGPSSRYFYDAARRGVTRDIYKAGNLLARAPAIVQGVAINRTGEPRLVVATYQGGEFRVYARPLRDRYTNDGLYDASSNPEGWRQLYAASEQPPFTPTFFNASGTEAQLITLSGNWISERVKLTIAGDVVARTSVSSVGRGVSRLEWHNRFPEDEHVLNKGKRVPRERDPGACNWQADCTRQTDCGTFLYCTLLEQDTSDTELQIYETNNRVVLSGKTAICVDYDGDTEILCEIAHFNDSMGRNYAVRRGRVDLRTRLETQCGGVIVQHGSEMTEHAELHSESWSAPGQGLRTLRLASIEIPVTGHRSANGYDSVVDYVTADGVRFAPTGSVHHYATLYRVSARILYADARNQTVVYESEESLARTDLTSDSPASDGTWQDIRGAQSGSVIKETVAYVRGQRYSLSREELPPLESLPPSVLLPQGPMDAIQSCHDKPSEYVDVQESVFRDAADWTTLIHPRANDAGQSYAIDREGNYVVSQPLWRLSGNSLVQVGTWSAISDADIDTLFPGAGAGGTFSEIKLLE